SLRACAPPRNRFRQLEQFLTGHYWPVYSKAACLQSVSIEIGGLPRTHPGKSTYRQVSSNENLSPCDDVVHGLHEGVVSTPASLGPYEQRTQASLRRPFAGDLLEETHQICLANPRHTERRKEPCC